MIAAVAAAVNPLRAHRPARRIDGWFLSRRPPSRHAGADAAQRLHRAHARPAGCWPPRCCVLLVASINYQLNLGYLLTFLLAGSVAVGMHVRHGTLRGLAMHLMAPDPQFAGAAAVFRVVLHNTRRSARYGIGLAVRRSGHWAWCDVPARRQRHRRGGVPARAPRRLHPVPHAHAPRRAFRSAPSASGRCGGRPRRCWSIPAPGAASAAAARRASRWPATAARRPRCARQLAGEYDGVRAYRRGDPLKLVVWKKARAGAGGRARKTW